MLHRSVIYACNAWNGLLGTVLNRRELCRFALTVKAQELDTFALILIGVEGAVIGVQKTGKMQTQDIPSKTLKALRITSGQILNVACAAFVQLVLHQVTHNV
jgi:hypothetical protein